MPPNRRLSTESRPVAHDPRTEQLEGHCPRRRPQGQRHGLFQSFPERSTTRGHTRLPADRGQDGTSRASRWAFGGRSPSVSFHRFRGVSLTLTQKVEEGG